MTYFIRVSGEEEITVLVPKFNESNMDYTIQDEIVNEENKFKVIPSNIRIPRERIFNLEDLIKNQMSNQDKEYFMNQDKTRIDISKISIKELDIVNYFNQKIDCKFNIKKIELEKEISITKEESDKSQREVQELFNMYF